MCVNMLEGNLNELIFPFPPTLPQSVPVFMSGFPCLASESECLCQSGVYGSCCSADWLTAGSCQEKRNGFQLWGQWKQSWGWMSSSEALPPLCLAPAVCLRRAGAALHKSSSKLLFSPAPKAASPFAFTALFLFFVSVQQKWLSVHFRGLFI